MSPALFHRLRKWSCSEKDRACRLCHRAPASCPRPRILEHPGLFQGPSSSRAMALSMPGAQDNAVLHIA